MNENSQLPNDWKRVKLGDLCDKISLNKIKIKQKDYLSEGIYPVVDQGQDLIGGYYNDEKLVIPNEPPYIIFGDHTKIKKYINFKFIAGADGVKVLKPKEIIDSKFLYYSLFTIKIEDKGYARHFQLLEKELFPLPPKPTQQAIVSKIEELFSELDKGIEQLKTAQQQLKTYRQSVLKWAFEGRLTNGLNYDPYDLHDDNDLNIAAEPEDVIQKNKKQVNQKNNLNQGSVKSELPKGWNMVPLKDLAELITDGDHQAPPKAREGVPFITISNVNKASNKIDFSNTFSVTNEYYYNLKENRKPKNGDILYTVTGSFGIPVLVDFDKEFCFQRHIGLIRPLKSTNQKWLYYLLRSPDVFNQAKDTATGTAQKTVALSSLRNFQVFSCSIEEQHSIVQAIESRLTLADKIEESITQSLQQAEALRQSILKNAFEGRLV
ncbi:MAG: restriction endonuclease subunit S [Ferruginibacter sp.]